MTLRKVVRFQVRLDDTYNAKLMAEYEASGKTKKDKKYLRDNGDLYHQKTVPRGNRVFKSHKLISERVGCQLKIREKAPGSD
jgi:hypothetical protein